LPPNVYRNGMAFFTITAEYQTMFQRIIKALLKEACTLHHHFSPSRH
jgi:hypothetical protein